MASGLTQAQLARQLGQSQHYVSRYELGDRRLDVFELDAICTALGTTLEEMWTLLRPLMAPALPAPRSFASLSQNSRRPRTLPTREPAPVQSEEKPAPGSVGADAKRRVGRALVLLQSESDEPVSIEAVASAVGWSADHLRRMFRAVLDSSPHQVELSARLGRARARLLEENAPVSRVAQGCGFANASHFAQVFKREFGLSPRQLRAGSAVEGKTTPLSTLLDG